MNSELKLSLENFQSISEGELVFKPGLNFIIGQSNSGKSATFRALKACLTNPSGSQNYIKNGYSRAYVTIEYDGNSITWKRSAKESSYTINGEDYIKTGRSNAFKIMDNNTGFVQHTNGDIMNIEEELQLPFPFGFSSADLFRLFENVFCVSDSATILKSAKGCEDDVKAKISQIEADITKNNRKLEELRKFREELNLDKLEKMLSSFKKKCNTLNNFKKDFPVINKALQFDRAKLEVSIFNPSDKMSKLEELSNLIKVITKLKKIHSLYKSLPNILKSDDKSSQYEELIKLSKEVQKIEELSKITLCKLDINDKSSKYKELVALEKEVIKISEIDNIIFPKLNIPDKSEQLENLKKDLEFIKELKSKVKELQLKKDNATSYLKEVENKLKEYKVCPLCGHPIEEGEDKC